jgi:hypothetical protein
LEDWQMTDAQIQHPACHSCRLLVELGRVPDGDCEVSDRSPLRIRILGDGADELTLGDQRHETVVVAHSQRLDVVSVHTPGRVGQAVGHLADHGLRPEKILDPHFIRLSASDPRFSGSAAEDRRDPRGYA